MSEAPKSLSDADREYCRQRLERGAYYYGFEATGDPGIDLVLGAVSAAGKAFHHTDSWNDEAVFDAGSCVDLIQAAANEAARTRTEVVSDTEQHPPVIYAGEWDQIGLEEWMGVASTYQNPGRAEYRRADLHSLPDEVVELAESLLTRANHNSFIPVDEWASLAEKVLAAVERKP